MAYDVSKMTKLAALKELATKLDTAIDAEVAAREALAEKVDTLVSTGGEPNVIESVKVNGTALEVTDKAVDVLIPAYSIVKAEESGEYAAVYNLTKDGSNTGATINIPKDMVVSSGSVVELDADAAAAAGLSEPGTYIKLVIANATNDTLYINVNGLIEYVTSGSAEGDMVVITVDDTTHKVTAAITDGTITKAKLASDVQAALDAVAGKVDAEEGKGLSAEDYTTEEKTKLAGISEGATKVTASTTAGNIVIDGVETTVVSIATDEEVSEMLTDVFGA